ncbi:unnamed protein product [Bursaphelenchus xylophilus]|uniref:RNA exonuclease 4 n=1 Tax=Bursaphelenchus xylophilus TaxID=6326 RepID=A0A1I7SBU3_BURXY|nr:unnamed protein product [Bursaphelenchus xylophilus]CAG9113016.1 unnamed protein product [Bursaphelenchus xylophilus]
MSSKPSASTAGSNWESLKKELKNEKKTGKIQFKTIKKEKKVAHKVNRFKEAHSQAVQSLKGGDANAITDVLAIDCEYVGVGFNGNIDHLARVSIVNSEGKVVYDKYVKPREEVTDYRTHVSGIRPGHLVNGLPFNQVQQEVNKLLTNKTVVGHGLCNDFRVMNLSHPMRLTRDSSTWKPLRKMINYTGKPSLKVLAEKLLNIKIQEGEHDSVIDARTALRIYQLHKKKWDADIKQMKK